MRYDIIQLVTRSDTIGGVHNHIIDLTFFSKKNNLKTLILCGDSLEKKFIKRLFPFSTRKGIFTSSRY